VDDSVANVAESVNVVASFPSEVAQLSDMLHRGWRSFLPSTQL
jgi:hypothetical protein